MDTLYNIAIVVFAFVGFMSALAIRRIRRKENYHIHCTKSCLKVITSRFSHFLGFQVEQVGIAYYLFTFTAFLANLFFPFSRELLFGLIALTLIAFAYNLHLVFVQLVVLKRWCTVCLWSSASSFMITVLAFLGYHYSFGYELFELRDIFSWLYSISVIIGVAVSTLYMRKFIRFMRDMKITRYEDRILSMFSHTAWIAITVAGLSGAALVAVDQYGEITENSKFPILLTLVALLFVYELILNHFVVPHLIDMHFGEREPVPDHHYSYLRKIAFAFLFLGLSTWYSLLVFSVFPFYKWDTLTLFGVFLGVTIVFVGVSLYLERIYEKIAHAKSRGSEGGEA